MIEMLVTVAIIALTSVLATLGYNNWIGRSQLLAAAGNVASAVREAQTRAMGQHTCYRVRFGATAAQVTVEYAPPDANVSTDPAQPVDTCPAVVSAWSQLEVVQLPDGISFIADPALGWPGSAGSDGLITFDATGMAQSFPAPGNAAVILHWRAGDQLRLQIQPITGAVQTSRS